MVKDTVIEINSREEYDSLINYLVGEGKCTWSGGSPLRDVSMWSSLRNTYCFRIQDYEDGKGILNHADRQWYESKGCTILSLEEFFAERVYNPLLINEIPLWPW